MSSRWNSSDLAAAGYSSNGKRVSLGAPGTQNSSEGSPAFTGAPKRKFRNKPGWHDGIYFDSQVEIERYKYLRATGVRGLECHPRYEIKVNGEKICAYECDFKYLDRSGNIVVEDVKSPTTKDQRAFRIKGKLMHAVFNLSVMVVMYNRRDKAWHELSLF